MLFHTRYVIMRFGLDFVTKLGVLGSKPTGNRGGKIKNDITL